MRGAVGGGGEGGRSLRGLARRRRASEGKRPRIESRADAALRLASYGDASEAASGRRVLQGENCLARRCSCGLAQRLKLRSDSGGRQGWGIELGAGSGRPQSVAAASTAHGEPSQEPFCVGELRREVRRRAIDCDGPPVWAAPSRPCRIRARRYAARTTSAGSARTRRWCRRNARA
jgi:hypothetical protein